MIVLLTEHETARLAAWSTLAQAILTFFALLAAAGIGIAQWRINRRLTDIEVNRDASAVKPLVAFAGLTKPGNKWCEAPRGKWRLASQARRGLGRENTVRCPDHGSTHRSCSSGRRGWCRSPVGRSRMSRVISRSALTRSFAEWTSTVRSEYCHAAGGGCDRAEATRRRR